MTTIPDIFIIESLGPDDEGNGRLEGPIIAHIARLHGKNPTYRYVRNRKDFAKAVRAFSKSNYRYLHISAHADDEGITTTNLEDVTNAALAKMLGKQVAGRRIFFSACSIIHEKMAAEIIPPTKVFSVVGPREDIGFAQAAVFWTALYHLMFEHDALAMKRAALIKNLKKVASLCDVEIGYFGRSASRKSGFSRDILAVKG
ncbi:hypothetical protein M2341_001313 [Sphingobium sp. B7D2B]|uniref:hypothetical protein n=1 Tax=Sphingobium sp. B7D2B TaxID=2940583 RepID=UPI00222502DB|nr:hypothetical protein [Sphingobium sp. B7D2B]MCW2365866.1 hypothetical protein [Sphingobium sp. B7D2B]